MSQDTKENILVDVIEYTHISLISSKTKVLIVGGGRAGYIKAKSFASKGCKVSVLSQEFICDFNHVQKLENVSIIKDEYKSSFIDNKHLVVIAVNNNELRRKIKEDCEKLFKLYLDCTDFKEGQFVMPVQRKTKNVTFSLNTKSGSPKAAMFLGDVIDKTLNEYDEFIEYLCTIREEVKTLDYKDKILNFIASEDFRFFYNKGKNKEILRMFFHI